MKSKYVIMEASAMSDKVKATTLAQEVIRRLRNTHRLASKEERREVLSDFAVKMKRSGYREEVRRRALEDGLKGYNRMIEEEENGKRRLYRRQETGQRQRYMRKVDGRSSWFKEDRGKEQDVLVPHLPAAGGPTVQIQPGAGRGGTRTAAEKEVEVDKGTEAVLFIAHTPHGELKKRIQEREDRLTKGFGSKRVKVVERGGRH